MISTRIRLELDRINREPLPKPDDGGPSLVFAALCIVLSAAIAVGVIVWVVRMI